MDKKLWSGKQKKRQLYLNQCSFMTETFLAQTLKQPFRFSKPVANVILMAKYLEHFFKPLLFNIVLEELNSAIRQEK